MQAVRLTNIFGKCVLYMNDLEEFPLAIFGLIIASWAFHNQFYVTLSGFLCESCWRKLVQWIFILQIQLNDKFLIILRKAKKA